MNIEAAVATLKANFANLTDKDQAFAFDLVASFDRRGSVSEKQAVWIVKLAERATAPATQAEAANVGDMAGVYALFTTAKASGLKYPKIVVSSPVGEIKLSVAGPNARVPGSINVAENSPFGEAKYYGRIIADGSFEGRSAPAELVAYLRDFAANPAETAAMHGRQTGCCCFCSRELNDARSVAVGYGPVCAENFGLPWGEDTVETKVEAPAAHYKAPMPYASERLRYGKRGAFAA